MILLESFVESSDSTNHWDFFFFETVIQSKLQRVFKVQGNNRILGPTVYIVAVYHVCICMEPFGSACLIIVLDLKISPAIFC